VRCLKSEVLQALNVLWFFTGGVNLNYILYINIAVHITLQVMVLVGLV